MGLDDDDRQHVPGASTVTVACDDAGATSIDEIRNGADDVLYDSWSADGGDDDAARQALAEQVAYLENETAFVLHSAPGLPPGTTMTFTFPGDQ